MCKYRYDSCTKLQSHKFPVNQMAGSHRYDSCTVPYKLPVNQPAGSHRVPASFIRPYKYDGSLLIRLHKVHYDQITFQTMNLVDNLAVVFTVQVSLETLAGAGSCGRRTARRMAWGSQSSTTLKSICWKEDTRLSLKSSL